MFRRIEIIGGLSPEEYRELIEAAQKEGRAGESISRFWKTGIMGGQAEVFDVWSQIPSPGRTISRNCRFYFTEEGWGKFGRSAIAACQQTGQSYRVIRIKENSVDVIYRDHVQVAVRPRKEKRNQAAPSRRADPEE